MHRVPVFPPFLSLVERLKRHALRRQRWSLYFDAAGILTSLGERLLSRVYDFETR